jgi:hypothetical protein
LEIPTEFKEFVKLENNTLEFVASMVLVWLTILTCIKEGYPCFLALGDNMSAVSWLHKANVDENENKPLHLATRKYAEILMQHNCCLYSQHIQGEKNKVADALSRLHHLSPLCMHTYIISNFPSQVPPTPTQNILLGDLMAAEDQRSEGVGEGTKSKETRVWK